MTERLCPRCLSENVECTTKGYISGPDMNRASCCDCRWEGRAYELRERGKPMPAAERATCKTCRFYVQAGPYEMRGEGTCRRQAPNPAFPWIHEAERMWCGKYEREVPPGAKEAVGVHYELKESDSLPPCPKCDRKGKIAAWYNGDCECCVCGFKVDGSGFSSAREAWVDACTTCGWTCTFRLIRAGLRRLRP